MRRPGQFDTQLARGVDGNSLRVRYRRRLGFYFDCCVEQVCWGVPFVMTFESRVTRMQARCDGPVNDQCRH